MKLVIIRFMIFFWLFVSCKYESGRETKNLRTSHKKDSVFKNINAAWRFSKKSFTSDTQSIIKDWNEWESFQRELVQKPKSTISAFQQKIKAICTQAIKLNNNIPEVFDTPQIKSRIMVMITKMKALESFIMLDNIPYEKVKALIPDINLEIKGLQEQMEIITIRKKSNLEEGEAEMLKSLKYSKAEKIRRKIVS